MPSLTRTSTNRALEAGAVALSIAYTWLYLRGHYPLCYLPAFVGSVLFTILCLRKQLYAETFLHVFYMFMAVYGALGMDGFDSRELSLSGHFKLIVLGTFITVLTGILLKRKTNARLPTIDAFTTGFSLIATWLMVNYVHENWLYWMVINSVSVFLYAYRRMVIAAGLFVVYLAMSIDGYFAFGWF